jgi:hypothetical protein
VAVGSVRCLQFDLLGEKLTHQRWGEMRPAGIEWDGFATAARRKESFVRDGGGEQVLQAVDAVLVRTRAAENIRGNLLLPAGRTLGLGLCGGPAGGPCLRLCWTVLLFGKDAKCRVHESGNKLPIRN